MCRISCEASDFKAVARADLTSEFTPTDDGVADVETRAERGLRSLSPPKTRLRLLLCCMSDPSEIREQLLEGNMRRPQIPPPHYMPRPTPEGGPERGEVPSGSRLPPRI